jgi:hypothetical protein
MRSFYQDKLGTNIGKTQKKMPFSQVPWSILVPGFGGRFGSEALAEALFGKFSPSGRLGYTVSHGRSKQCSAGAPTDAGTFEAG